MNTESSMYSNDIFVSQEEIVKRLRALDPSIDVQERDMIAGHLIEAQSPDGNIPTVNILLNEINGQLIIRLEIIGNITQYTVDEVITYLQKNFEISYLEVTDPRTGLIKFSLSKKSKSTNLFEIYKRELFKFHYPRDDGRLILLYDQGSIWIHPVVKRVVSKPQILKKPLQPKPIAIKKEILVKKPTPKVEEEKLKEPPVPEPAIESTVKEVTEPAPAEKTATESAALKRALKAKLDLSQKEQTILKLVESKPNKKVQSKGLRKELPSMDQDTIRNILRSLVAKGLLYVRSAWYIVKEDPSEDTWDIASETPIEERLQSLTPKERKIYEILEKRPGNKAQARMLIKETKMTKENLKKLLRNMVAKDVLFVYAAWYCIKE